MNTMRTLFIMGYYEFAPLPLRRSHDTISSQSKIFFLSIVLDVAVVVHFLRAIFLSLSLSSYVSQCRSQLLISAFPTDPQLMAHCEQMITLRGEVTKYSAWLHGKHCGAL